MRIGIIVGGCLIGVVLPAWTGVAAAPVEVRLGREGRAAVQIHHGPEAGAAVRKTAQELADLLGRIVGDAFEVSPGDGTAGLVLGVPADFKALPVATDFGTGPFDREDYRIVSGPGGLWLIGSTAVAVQHAAWDLLHRLGYRQYFPGPAWEIVPSDPNLAIAVDVRERPDFHARRIWYGWGLQDFNRGPYERWMARNRMGRAFDLRSGHAYGSIVKENRAAFDAHPEYFASLDGKRVDRGGSSKFCIGNPDLRALVVETMVRRVAADPTLDSVSLEPSDGGGWCDDTCDLCRRIGSGSVSDRVLTLANEVAAAINGPERSRDTAVGIYAYSFHAPPPTIPVHPRVVVSAATAFMSGTLSFDEIVRGWEARGATMGVYDYFSVVSWDRSLPHLTKASYPADLAVRVKHYHDMGIRFCDAESTDAWGPFGLGYYVAARTLWDVREADRVAAITAEFLDHAFGTAREPMAEWYRLLNFDTTLRSRSDLLGRLYRLLDEARRCAADRPDVIRRIDDLVLYTRYVELHERTITASAAEHQAAIDALLTYAYRIRERMMVHSYGIWNRTIGQREAIRKDHPLKSTEPVTAEELLAIVRDGIAAHEPVELDFTPVAYSLDLVPAQPALRLPDVTPGVHPRHPQVRQKYHLWMPEPGEFPMTVTVQRVWAKRPPLLTLHAAKDPTVSAVQEIDSVKPDGVPTAVVLRTPYDGLHWLTVHDGGDFTRFEWPAGLRVTLPSPLDDPVVHDHFRGPWTLYCYVPRGTQVVAGWAARKGRQPLGGTLRGPDGAVLWDFARQASDGWFRVPVPAGQDGTLWKFDTCLGVRNLVTVPSYFARTAEELLLPAEVVRADAEAVTAP